MAEIEPHAFGTARSEHRRPVREHRARAFPALRLAAPGDAREPVVEHLVEGELGRFALPLGRLNDAALATLYKVLHDWFPGVARLSQAQRWKGARPMLPDGPPVLGRSGIEGVWLNLGHGSSGWALSCGSARVLADAIAGRAPAIDVEGLGVERLVG